ncbi:MAG: hypothetical protein JSS10_01560 [Verrucomicrobia bacterium]|nr:hypothetical protein [Verrucomicrobiota bacterium]
MTKPAAPTAKTPALTHRPLPPTPATSKAAAVAKEALKPAPRRVSSLYALAERKSSDLTWPSTPDELSGRVSEWVLRATNHPDQKEKYITNARELLDEFLIKTLLYDDSELQKLWIDHIRLGYTAIDGFTKYHKMPTGESRFVDLCQRIMEHHKLQDEGKETLENLQQTEKVEPSDLPLKNNHYINLRTISMIAVAALSLVGLFFTTRICIHRLIVKQ